MLVYDELRLANWQRTKDGTQNRNRPERISPLAKSRDRKIGGTDMPQDEVRAWLRKIGPPSDDDDGAAPASTVVVVSESTHLNLDDVGR